MSGWVAGAIVVGGALGANASTKAARTQAAAADRATESQERMFERNVELQEPWRQAGVNALAKMGTGFTGQVDLTQDPGYAFRMSEGMKALERGAAARGGLLSGGTLKATQRFGQDLASQEYQNAYNRALTQYNTTAALAGVGQTTAQQLGQAGMLAAQNIGQTQMAGAAARASGYVGGANALNQGLGTYLNYSQGQSLLNALRRPTPMGGGGGGGVTGTQYDFSGISEYG